MKVFCRPEVLEDHIAPASLPLTGVSGIGFVPGDSTLIPVSNNIGNPAIPVNVVGDPSLATVLEPTLQPDAPFQSVAVSDADGSLLGISTFRFQDALFQSPLVNTTFGDIFSESARLFLADELSISIGVIGAIESAIGLQRSAGLAGLTSDEFERAPGSAFLTPL